MHNISVIIPIFNTKKDILDRCIKSALNQTYADFELILVDDGSEEACAHTINSYASQDERIIIVRHQKNMGIGAARNTGMAIATGNYVCFVDSDDEILPDYLERYYDIMEKYDLDMVSGGYYRIYAGGYTKEVKASLFDCECYTLESIELLIGHVLTGRMTPTSQSINIGGTTWCKMFRMNIAKKAEFPTSIRTIEDLIYLVSLAKYLTRVGFINFTGYKYYSYSYSLSHRDFDGIVEDRERGLTILRRHVLADMPSAFPSYCFQAVMRYGEILVKKTVSLTDVFKNLKFPKELAQRELFKEGFEGINTKHPSVKYYYWLLIFFVKHKLWLCVNLLFYAHRIKRTYFRERFVQ